MSEDFEETLKELISKIPDNDIIEIGEITIKHDEIDKLIDEVISRTPDSDS